MAFGTFDLTSEHPADRYPASGTVGGRAAVLRLMTRDDGDAMLAFARGLPVHDLLFLRRDITQPEQIERWLASIDEGVFTTLLLLDDADVICGYATVDHYELTWQRHIAELRVLVGAEMRGHGVGRLLTEEAFRIALAMGVEKVVGQMTVDQEHAIAVFRSLGFQPEALLRDHVKDRDGRKNDLVILSHDVASFQSKLAAVGTSEALGGY